MGNEIESVEERLRRLTAEASSLIAEETQSTALVAQSTGTALAPADVKKALAKQHAAVVYKMAELKKAQEAFRTEMERMMSASHDLLAPLQAQVAMLKEGIWAVNLYLGREEELVALRGGEPAPAETPLDVYQAVLAMDEETAAFPETGGMDADNIEVFEQWLLADPAHLDQVAPSPKCVVVCIPRRQERDYGSPYANATRNAANKQSHWIIRNGERVYRMTTEITVGERLMPLRDEFTGLFRAREYDWKTRGYVTVDLVPGTDAWLRAEKKQGARQRHFMRVALILQGLMDRTSVFTPLPNGEPFSLLHPEAYERGLVRIVANAEANQLTTRQPAFYTWLAGLNAKLRPGMHIIGSFKGQAWAQANKHDERPRVRPETASSPQSNTIYRLDERVTRYGDAGWLFRYVRTDKVCVQVPGSYRLEQREAKNRASCFVMASDRFILPLDLVTVDEMRAYLHARTERHAYITMMPLLHAAIAVKEAEAEAEAPFRQLLAGEIAKARNVSVSDAEVAVPELVDWWKLANRWHRPLVTGLGDDRLDRATEAKAVRLIVAEFGARAKIDPQANDRDSAAVARLRELDPQVLFIGRTRSGGYLAFAPQPRTYGEHTTAPSTWTREYTLGSPKGAASTREWILPGNRATRTTELFASPRLERLGSDRYPQGAPQRAADRHVRSRLVGAVSQQKARPRGPRHHLQPQSQRLHLRA